MKGLARNQLTHNIGHQYLTAVCFSSRPSCHDHGGTEEVIVLCNRLTSVNANPDP